MQGFQIFGKILKFSSLIKWKSLKYMSWVSYCSVRNIWEIESSKMSPTHSLPLAKSEDISPYGNAWDDQSLKELISLETDLMYFWSFIDHQGAVYEKKNILTLGSRSLTQRKHFKGLNSWGILKRQPPKCEAGFDEKNHKSLAPGWQVEAFISCISDWSLLRPNITSSSLGS